MADFRMCFVRPARICISAGILAASQLIAVIVPVLWEVAKFLAIVILALMAAALLVMLLMDRR
jgi:hypothetical protein